MAYARANEWIAVPNRRFQILTNIFALPEDVQQRPELLFAVNVAEAVVQHNYARFFQLLRTRATYLQACLMHQVRFQCANGAQWKGAEWS